MPRLSKIGAAALGAFGWTTGAAAVTADFLVIAGGGGSGGISGGQTSGGGGAGGFRTSAGTSGGGGSAEGKLSLNPLLSYTVTVGAGGIGGSTDISGTQGNDSVFSTITSTGGGYGGKNTAQGGTGGSGGGSGYVYTSAGGSGTANQGYAGGAGKNSGGDECGGGGGGAGAVGANASSTGGNGGAGTTSSISGTSTTYAGGGGGGAYQTRTAGTGGSGGGGAGANNSNNPTAGTANLGGGGGGVGGGGASVVGANGGSGVVIISYLGAQQFGGGVVTSSGGYTIHTFNTSGTLSPLSSLTINNILLVAGGGGGGSVYGGGGGGAGGFITSSSSITVDTNSTYLVTVGAGGAGSGTGGGTASSGTNSQFSMYATTAVGGGGGGSYGVPTGTTGGSGGSGGGGGSSDTSGNASTGGSATSGQGSAGGAGGRTGSPLGGGGGGGAGAAGTSWYTASAGGAGGVGLTSSISGTSTYYAGGGGGGGGAGSGAGTGGNGGGGAGVTSGTGTAGTANTGGGGGGGGDVSTIGGQGGSGIVIISYAGATQQMAGGTVTISGGNVIHTFTSSGYLTPLKLVNNSLRFRSSASAYLSRTPTTAGNTQKFTFSAWIKRGILSSSSNYRIFQATDTSSGAYEGFEFAGDTFGVRYFTSSFITVQTSAVLRDPAAWYHLVGAIDTTDATSSNRIKLYINGVQQATTGTQPAQNYSFPINGAVPHAIASYPTGGEYFDGYMTEINVIDGQALTPNSFGTFNSYGVWQPITYGGSYGTNGFYLPFGQGSSTYAASFNGSSQRLLTSTSASLALGTNDFTVEYWVYFNATTVGQIPVTGGDGTTNYDAQFGYYDTGNILALYLSSNGSTWGISSGQTIGAVTTGKWYNVAITRSGSTFYTFLNGVQGATFTSSSSISQSANSFGIGKAQASNYVNGYISNVRVIIGTCLYTTNFVPSTTPLTAVTNTKLLTLQNATIVDNSTNALTFTNTGSVTTAVQYPFLANVTLDSSPAGNNWTSNNIGVLNNSSFDSMTDVPTLTSTTAANYCTLNPLNLYTGTSCANGNLQGTTVTGAECGIYGTIGMTSGKFYWESTPSSISSGGCMIGIAPATTQGSSGSPGLAVTTGYGYYTTGSKYGGSGGIAYGNTFTTSDVIGCALDLDNGKIWWSKNGVFQASGDPAAGTNAAFTSVSGTFVPGIGNGGAGSFSTVNVNFGQQPFAYTPPTGFVALNTYNI